MKAFAAARRPLSWEDVQVFLAVVHKGSISGAAAALGVNHSTVLRRIGSLEQALGARLFDRLPGGYALTSSGNELAERLSGDAGLDEVGIGPGPVPFRSGEIFVRRQCRLVRVVAANEKTAARSGLHHDLGAVDMHGDHIDALVGKRVGGFGFLDRKTPLAGEDRLYRDGGID